MDPLQKLELYIDQLIETNQELSREVRKISNENAKNLSKNKHASMKVKEVIKSLRAKNHEVV